MIQSWLQKWAGQPLGEYSRRGGRPHVGAFWKQIHPYRLVQKYSVYAISEPQQPAVQFPFLRGALRPPVPPRFSTQFGDSFFVWVRRSCGVPRISGGHAV